jgi:hypothetical protein
MPHPVSNQAVVVVAADKFRPDGDVSACVTVVAP